MSRLDLDQWQRLWQAATLRGKGQEWFCRLEQCYAQPHRYYHNAQHLAECLAEFNTVKHIASDPISTELAIWFHDVVYDPRKLDNEEESACWANYALSEAKARLELRQRVSSLIMTTKSHQAGDDVDNALVVDLDLGILGAPERRYSEYEAAIRAEYSWVPADQFALKRAEILRRFLSRERIYSTEILFRRWERQARSNLAGSVGRLTENGRHQ